MDAFSESARLHDESLRIRNSLRDGEPDLSLDRFRRIVERWNRCLSDEPPGPLFKGVVTPHNVRLAAQNAAEIAHTVLQNLARDPEARTPVSQAESAYEDVLSLLRSGARNESRELIALAFETLAGPVLDAAAGALVSTDADTTRDDALDAVRAHHLMHRICAVLAAIPGLQLRQMQDRSRSSLAGIASRRTSLLTPGLPTGYSSVTRIRGHAPGERIALLGFAESASWIDRRDRPYTELKLGSGEELRVHFRNARRQGITGQQWIWARCKVEEPDDGTHYAVAEFEGPTTTDNECWESWLQVQARSHYDIAPASLHLYTSGSDYRLDLYSRLAADEEAA
jgi:hypothetical protein